MPNPVQTAVEHAFQTTIRLAGVPITYVAGTQRLSITAVRTEADVDVVQADGAVVTARVTDWRFRREDLVQAGRQITPARTHRIEYLRGSVKQTYEVQPASGESCYTPADPYEYGWKVRTKRISEE